MQATLFRHADCKAQPLGNGVTRRVLAYDEKLMFAEVRCEAGGSGPVHSHPHAQNTYVLSGRFLFTAERTRLKWGRATASLSPRTCRMARAAWKRARCWMSLLPCARIFCKQQSGY